MKTVVSIPDRVFRSAQQLADWWKISRSELYTRALTALIEKHGDEIITARLNEVYGSNREESALGAGLSELQQRTLRQNT
jgi:hypothetical protein